MNPQFRALQVAKSHQRKLRYDLHPDLCSPRAFAHRCGLAQRTAARSWTRDSCKRWRSVQRLRSQESECRCFRWNPFQRATSKKRRWVRAEFAMQQCGSRNWWSSAPPPPPKETDLSRSRTISQRPINRHIAVAITLMRKVALNTLKNVSSNTDE